MTSYAMSEVKKHHTKNNAWIVIHNKIYNVTAFLKEHPGGMEVLLDMAGRDATEAFESIGHSNDARALMKKFCIGDLKGSTNPSNLNGNGSSKAVNNAYKNDSSKNTKSAAKSVLQPAGNRLPINAVIFTGFLIASFSWVALENPHLLTSLRDYFHI